MTSKLLEQLVFVLRNETCQSLLPRFRGQPATDVSCSTRRVFLRSKTCRLRHRASRRSLTLRMAIISPPGCRRCGPTVHFPQMTIGNPQNCPWPYLRRNSPHNWYIDRRWPAIGFVSRDEAHILYNTALQAAGMPALEIGAFMGWSACHLALAGVDLDVIDPLLGDQAALELVSSSLRSAEVLDKCHLIGGRSPAAVDELARRTQQTLEPHLHRWRSRRRSAAPGRGGLHQICGGRLYHPVP